MKSNIISGEGDIIWKKIIVLNATVPNADITPKEKTARYQVLRLLVAVATSVLVVRILVAERTALSANKKAV